MRTLFVLLNRSLLSSTDGGVFVQAVAASLSEFLHHWQRDLSTDFFASIFHIVEELVVLVCGAQAQENWNDFARHAILSVTLKVLDLSVEMPASAGNGTVAAHLPAPRVMKVLQVIHARQT